jgi:hypothetical protein
MPESNDEFVAYEFVIENEDDGYDIAVHADVAPDRHEIAWALSGVTLIKNSRNVSMYEWRNQLYFKKHIQHAMSLWALKVNDLANRVTLTRRLISYGKAIKFEAKETYWSEIAELSYYANLDVVLVNSEVSRNIDGEIVALRNANLKMAAPQLDDYKASSFYNMAKTALPVAGFMIGGPAGAALGAATSFGVHKAVVSNPRSRAIDDEVELNLVKDPNYMRYGKPHFDKVAIGATNVLKTVAGAVVSTASSIFRSDQGDVVADANGNDRGDINQISERNSEVDFEHDFDDDVKGDLTEALSSTADDCSDSSQVGADESCTSSDSEDEQKSPLGPKVHPEYVYKHDRGTDESDADEHSSLLSPEYVRSQIEQSPSIKKIRPRRRMQRKSAVYQPTTFELICEHVSALTSFVADDSQPPATSSEVLPLLGDPD